MIRYTRPLGWPLRRRRCWDVERAQLLHTAWVGRSRGGLYSQVAVRLYRTDRGRYFLTRFDRGITPIWRWQARWWLFRVNAPAHVVTRCFPRSITPA